MSHPWGSGTSPTAPVERDGSVVMKHKAVGDKNFIRKRFFKYDETKVPAVRLVRSSILKGYSPGSLINIVSVPKAGKTSFALQEVMTASIMGGDCLYMINESTKDRFLQIIRRRARELGYSTDDLKRIIFADMVDESISIPQYGAIESYMTRVWVGSIKYWLEHVKNPQYVVLDSFSEIVRKYIPQGYVAMKYFADELNRVMTGLKKYPVVLLVNQKSGGSYERNDESVLGGYGIVHKTDGSVLLRLKYLNKWDADMYGYPIGSVMHTIQMMEMRDMDVDSNEHILLKQDGRLVLGPSLGEIRAKVDKELNPDAMKPTVWTEEFHEHGSD